VGSASQFCKSAHPAGSAKLDIPHNPFSQFWAIEYTHLGYCLKMLFAQFWERGSEWLEVPLPMLGREIESVDTQRLLAEWTNG